MMAYFALFPKMDESYNERDLWLMCVCVCVCTCMCVCLFVWKENVMTYKLTCRYKIVH